MHQAEGFRLGTGVDDDIQRTNRRRGILDEAREADTIRQPEPGRCRPKLLDRHLAVAGLVHRAANHIGAHVQRGRQPGDRLEKDVVPLPTREGRDQADAHDPFGGSGKSGSLVEVEPVAIRGEAPKVHRIPDRADRRERSAKRSNVVGNAPRRRDHRRAEVRAPFQRRGAERPAGDVIVKVPDERRPRAARPRTEQVHLQPVGMNDVRRELTDDLPQSRPVAPRRPGDPRATRRQPQTRPAAFALVPFTEPDERGRERQHAHVRAQGPRARDERAVGPRDHTQARRRIGFEETGDRLEQRRLCAADPPGRVQEENPHIRRCRTTIVSSA